MDQYKFKEGDTAIYAEDGARLKVVVLENRSDPEQEAYRLRIAEVLKEHPLVSVHPGMKRHPGEEFDCFKKRVGSWGGNWFIDPMN